MRPTKTTLIALLRVLYTTTTTSSSSFVTAFSHPTHPFYRYPLRTLITTTRSFSATASVLSPFLVASTTRTASAATAASPSSEGPNQYCPSPQPQRRSTTSLAATGEKGESDNMADEKDSESKPPREEHTRDFQQPQQGNHNNNTADSLGLGTKSWRSLMEVSIARSRKIRGSNYVQLATVDLKTNEPRCRTVVFRGFLTLPHDHILACNDNDKDSGLPCVMKMCTDLKSQKVNESPAAEMVWWFAKSNEQYRIRGRLVFVGNGNDNFPHDSDKHLQIVRKELWGNLSDAARESFLDQAIPGQPIGTTPTTGDETASIASGGRDPETGKPVPPPDRFLLMLLVPHHVDYLHLQYNYRQVDEWSAKEGEAKEWSFVTVNA